MDVFEYQDKEAFSRSLQNALVDYGDGRYAGLEESPIVYREEGSRKWLERDGQRVADVSYLSLPTIAVIIMSNLQ